jgi:release factor glutamine methyltransferase
MKIESLINNPEYPQKFVLEKFICYFLGLTREQMRLQSDKEFTTRQENQILTAYNSYVIDKKPIEYVLWFVEFFGTKFIVNSDTLIPRPETEYMITAVTEYCQKIKKSDLVLLDVWTGCGVLGCSVLIQNPDIFKTVFLSEYSQEALIVAKQNYDQLIDASKYDTYFVYSDLVAYLENYKNLIQNKNIILVANLPYIPEKTHDDNNPESVKKREPRIAFVGGDDGLIYYRKMFDQIFEYKKEWIIHWELTMFLEMMTRQVELLVNEYGEKIHFEEVKTFHFNIRILKALIR